MGISNLNEIKNLVDNARIEIWQKAESRNRDPKIYLHWSAGRYMQFFSDYHINVMGSGQIYLSTDNLAATLSHTWRRNTGSIGISLCCGYGATTKNLGSYPPTKEQIEALARLVQVLADGLWLTIDKKHVMTHGEAADNEDGIWLHPMYGPKTSCERWDLEYLGTSESPRFNPYDEIHRGGAIIRGKGNWYRTQRGINSV